MERNDDSGEIVVMEEKEQYKKRGWHSFSGMCEIKMTTMMMMMVVVVVVMVVAVMTLPTSTFPCNDHP